jgi:8-oxo-dGTP pyrophosphatase MutT (NUDIX family)
MKEKRDFSIGVILYYEFPRKIKYLLLKHRQGHWTFCKGHKNRGETKIETAIRELREETGITKIKFLRKRVFIRENYRIKNKEIIKKSVDFFIAESLKKKVKIDKFEVLNYKWCSYKIAMKQITFKEAKSTLKKANKIIQSYLNV